MMHPTAASPAGFSARCNRTAARARIGIFACATSGLGPLIVVLVASLLATSCTAGPDPLERPFSFDTAPSVVYLWSFSSNSDIAPPTPFERFVIGEDALVGGLTVVKPYAIAVGEGKVYINDGRDNSAYWIYDLAERELISVPHPLLRGSLGIAVDEDDNKYLTVPGLREALDKGTYGKHERGKLLVFNRENKLAQSVEIAGRPIEVVVFGEEVFVTDGIGRHVLVLDRKSLEPVREIGKPGSEDPAIEEDERALFFPKGIAADDKGNIYVSDLLSGRIKVFSNDGGFISQYGNRSRYLGDFMNVSGLDVDRRGFVYVVDSNSQLKVAGDDVQIFDSSYFYRKGEPVPPLDADPKTKKNALWAYFMKPFARGTAVTQGELSLYIPVDIAIDYKNVRYFQHLMPEGHQIDYLIWMTSNWDFRKKNVSVFGHVAEP